MALRPPFAALALAALGATPAAADADGVAQLEDGRRNFVYHCASCHGDTLIGSIPRFGNAARLYDFFSASMPRQEPGHLEEAEYLSLLAYLLDRLGVPPAGTLTADREELARIALPGG